ncbi:hypothetical protein SAMN06297280_2737 [Arsukibacterium tuosuense]|uniref:Uncharacterized protein n=2 Tax=Arsukibacterium tuosuense TaxID=1323745 RepID=A0A285J3B3_9GAMM|nr:hypothetical protein SAMN06297280_2737 [Arsukibacterium tuosuense]
MSKRPGKGQTAKLISGEQANNVTSRYSFVFEKLQTDQERVIFIDEFIQRFSRVAWLTVMPKSEGFSDLTISAQRNTKQYHLGINIFQGMHETLLPKLDNFIVNERASAEVPQHISALIHFVITGVKTATPADSLNDSEDLLPMSDNSLVNEQASSEAPQYISALTHSVSTGIETASTSDWYDEYEDFLKWEDNSDYEEWAEEQAEGTCENFNQNEGADCKYRWEKDDDTGGKWITFWDRIFGTWTGYKYYRQEFEDPIIDPPSWMPY